ncbi:MAG: bifunctional nuclease family protein [Nitrospirae bacterium]|nr:bifunctional nuclease family protein [Nitrospirota bacterium]MBI3594899.1 bifunctional nuclease family protein [Nitrospirota bacterium]
MKIEVSVEGVILDAQSNQQMLVLKPKTKGDGKFLPIWIGNAEAVSIKTALSQNSTIHGRPLTHDLLKNMLAYFQVPLQKVVIYKLVQGTFFAYLYFSKDGSEWQVDSRPSDAISMAVRVNIPIFVEEDVYNKKQVRYNEKTDPIEIPKGSS